MDLSYILIYIQIYKFIIIYISDLIVITHISIFLPSKTSETNKRNKKHTRKDMVKLGQWVIVPSKTLLGQSNQSQIPYGWTKLNRSLELDS